MNIWDKVWDRDVYAKTKVRIRKANRKIQIYNKLGVNFAKYRKAVDFGTGGGYVISELLKMSPDIEQVVLYDNSIVGLETAKENLQGLTIKKKFIMYDLNLPISSREEKFDLAIAFSILEHLENIEQGIDNIYHSLKSNGELIMIWSNKKSVFYLQHKISESIGLWRYGLTIEKTEYELKSLLNNKFEVVSKTVAPCVGDKGIFTVVDRIMHKIFRSYGRYIVLYLKKVD